MEDLKSGCQRCQFSDKAFGHLIMCSRLSMFVSVTYIGIEKCYVHNIFTILLQQILSGNLLQVVIGGTKM